MIHEYGAKKVPGHKSVNMGVAENRTDPRAEGDAAAETGRPRLDGGRAAGGASAPVGRFS